MLTDLRLALRWLRHSPGFTGIAILTLALAIGANAAVFSIADAVLFRPLPYDRPDRVLTVRMQNRTTGELFTLVPADLVDAIQSDVRSVGDVARLEDGPNVTYDGPDGLTRIPTASVTANYFQVLGVTAYRGRVFAGAGEDAGARAAVLSYRAWRERFGGADDITGHSLTLGAETFDIVGVLPAGFVFPTPIAGSPELITILEGSIGANPNLRQLALGSGAFFPIVRLQPGVTAAQAQSELATVFRALGTSRDETVPVFRSIRSVLSETGAPIMRFMLAGSLLLLLLGCANLANVLIARGRRREKETGVRAALGATRAALVRPILAEAILIGIAGSLAAIVVARLAFTLMIGTVPPEAYLDAQVGVDGRVMAFALLLGCVSAIAFGIAPAWRAVRQDAQSLIQRRAVKGPPRAAVGTPLVAAQVAIAIVLVFGASIAGRAFISLVRQPLGFDPGNVLTVGVLPPGSGGTSAQDAYLRVIDAVSRIHGVETAGATASLPRIRENAEAPVYAPGTRDIVASQVLALPGYFQAARISVVAGRSYTVDEVRAGAPVAVVSQRAARALFDTQDPLGRSFLDDGGKAFTVVGVVADIRQRVERESEALVYTAPGTIRRPLVVLARVTGRNASVAADIRRAVSSVVPGVVATTAWWTDRINALAAYRNPRFQSMVLGSFAAIALALTALGVFGVVSLMVATRTREIGIRLALGSRPQVVVAHAVRRTLTPVIVGIVAGLVATRWLAGLAEHQLYQVDTRSPVVLAVTAAVVLLAGLVAAWFPARRAGAVDPVVALKAE